MRRSATPVPTRFRSALRYRKRTFNSDRSSGHRRRIFSRSRRHPSCLPRRHSSGLRSAARPHSRFTRRFDPSGGTHVVTSVRTGCYPRLGFYARRVKSTDRACVTAVTSSRSVTYAHTHVQRRFLRVVPLSVPADRLAPLNRWTLLLPTDGVSSLYRRPCRDSALGTPIHRVFRSVYLTGHARLRNRCATPGPVLCSLRATRRHLLPGASRRRYPTSRICRAVATPPSGRPRDTRSPLGRSPPALPPPTLPAPRPRSPSSAPQPPARLSARGTLALRRGRCGTVVRTVPRPVTVIAVRPIRALVTLISLPLFFAIHVHTCRALQ